MHKHNVSQIILKAKKEGCNHVDHLIDEYEKGKNRFENRGELLIGYQAENELIGICGLNIEPDNKKYGRIRRLYVMPEYRNRGIGSKLQKNMCIKTDVFRAASLCEKHRLCSCYSTY
ncbi:MAG: GNAT family N-acetyltransferase [Deltaproteobacteria bacterium]|nr:GNAT family N-acetyltransferase [Deltaproteobacteria bacterium]